LVAVCSTCCTTQKET